MRIREAEFVVFDLETTGLDAEKGDRICEIGAVKVKNSQITSSFKSLVNPARDIPPEAVKIHGITQKDIEAAPFFEGVIDGFSEFIAEAPLFGYNIGFDLSFLNAQLKALNRGFLKNPCVDILIICRKLLTGLNRFSLSSVAHYFKIPEGNFHRAHQDAYVAASIFLKLIPLLENKGAETLEKIYSLFGSPKL